MNEIVVQGDAPPQLTPSLLYLDGVTVTFDGFRALNNLSLQIQPGEMRAIIGPNGAGKTTMMDVITGKTRPDKGEVVFDHGVDLTQLDEAKIANLGIGRKFQKPTVFEHHTVEDTGLAIGAAIAQALGDKRGIRRYADALSPMDETLTRVALDISGRPYFVWKTEFSQKRLGEMDTEMFEHWFHSFAQTAGLTLHVETLYGTNNHHIAEAAFKGLARALREAVEIDPRKADTIPSTKGTL